ncbi:putative glycosyl [Erysiphe neolycopersici]|uniref:Putative glycosyl n=1 Tax=Erysiphe neolycopersici TaxID=212602 RepID=A0A420HWM3_9PEZI|nr:putative glycosyl [Erysiphe neolycopersici]
MKSNFEGPDYQRYNLKRCNELTFQNIIDSNPDKNPMEQITILTIALDKMQKTLSSEWQSEAVIYNKIVSTCKDIEACKIACYRPSQNVAVLILDLRSGVEIHNKPLATSTTATYHSESLNKIPVIIMPILRIEDIMTDQRS